MKTKNQIIERKEKAQDLVLYYLSHFPNFAIRAELTKSSDVFSPPLTLEAGLIVSRHLIEEKYGIESPEPTELFTDFTREFTVYKTLRWVLDKSGITEL